MNSDERRGRSAGTSRRSLAVRRMDSLARLVHSYDWDRIARGETPNPVVTAVGIRPRHGKRSQVVVAHNESNAAQREADFDRLYSVAQVLRGRRSAARLARELAPTSGLPGDPRSAERRLARDLRKLRRTYEGRDDARLGGRDLRRTLRDTFRTGASYSDQTEGQGIHAEAALLHQDVAGPLGVSKLSCHDCFQYGRRGRRETDLRGTHGLSFPGWTDPDVGSQSRDRVFDPRVNQYPSDSESETD